MAEASNSPEEQRSEGDSKPGKPRQSAKQENYRRWSVSLGLILLVLNGVFYFQFWLSDNLGWPIPLQDEWELQLLLYFLLGSLCYFIVGGIRGYSTGQSGAALVFSQLAVLTGMIPIILLSIVIGIAGNHRGDDMAGVEFLVGWPYLLLLGCIQLFVGAGAARLGGLIGSRLLHQRARPDATSQQG